MNGKSYQSIGLVQPLLCELDKQFEPMHWPVDAFIDGRILLLNLSRIPY
jgi:hypothetical protein